MRTPNRSLLAASALVALAALTACSGASKPATQVAVKVNDSELSIHQVNAQLARLSNVPADQHDRVRKQVVDALIDQQLLIEKAVEHKLDRDPEVLANIEQSRAQILAQAYVRKTLGSQAKPTDEEIGKYYGEHPELFAQRRVFRLEELSSDMPAERLDELRKVVAGAKSMSEVAQWLQKNQFKVAANVAVRAAEQLPMQQLGAINGMKDGDKAVFAADRRLTVLHLLASQSAPLKAEQASGAIEQFLGNRKRDEMARAEVKRLRDAARIEYVGEFNKLAMLKADTKAEPAAVAAEAAKPAVDNPAPAAPAAPARSTVADAVDKGVAGLR